MRQLSRTSESVHGRARPQRRVDGPDASARQHQSRQRGVAQALTWANPTLTRLEDQALVPMWQHPIELGLDRGDGWVQAFRRDPVYAQLFAAAFRDQPVPCFAPEHRQGDREFSAGHRIARSPYDRYHFERDDAAIWTLPNEAKSCSTAARCRASRVTAACTSRTPWEAESDRWAVEFHNTGLYNLPGLFWYPADNAGTYEVTQDAKDVGKFKAPTLRNIAVTAPYMHDGSVATLDDAVSHYAAGGRTISEGSYKGVGHDNPNKAAAIRGFALTAEQRSDLIAFLSPSPTRPSFEIHASPTRGRPHAPGVRRVRRCGLSPFFGLGICGRSEC